MEYILGTAVYCKLFDPQNVVEGVHPCYLCWMLRIKSLSGHVLFMRLMYQIHGTDVKNRE
jgi:disulfide bond formation protein DsbB